MSGSDRRTFIASLSATPLVRKWREALSTPQAAENDPNYRARSVAVELLRLLNTAEKWHFGIASRHVPLRELPGSEGFKKLNSSTVIERFRGVAEMLSPAASFSIPGYNTWLEVSPDGSRYSAVVGRKDSEFDFAFATDEGGLIYEGRPLSSSLPARFTTADKLIQDGLVIGEKRETGLQGWSRLFATIFGSRFVNLMAVPVPQLNGCACCYTYPTPCGNGCACNSTCPSNCTDGDYCCVNIGCSGCIWCRAARCSEICTDCIGCQGVCAYDCRCVY